MKKQKKGKKGEECLGRKGLLGEREVEQSETGGMGMAKASDCKSEEQKGTETPGNISAWTAAYVKLC